MRSVESLYNIHVHVTDDMELHSLCGIIMHNMYMHTVTQYTVICSANQD